MGRNVSVMEITDVGGLGYRRNQDELAVRFNEGLYWIMTAHLPIPAPPLLAAFFVRGHRRSFWRAPAAAAKTSKRTSPKLQSSPPAAGDSRAPRSYTRSFSCASAPLSALIPDVEQGTIYGANVKHHAPSAFLIASAISLVRTCIRSSDSASTMTRANGSVPE